MASHDKKILKYLQKNPSPPPSLIDLMGKLKMSIPDLTAGLDELVRQGLIRKDLNADGIEIYSLGGSSGPQPADVPSASATESNIRESPAPQPPDPETPASSAAGLAQPADSPAPVSSKAAIREQIASVTPDTGKDAGLPPSLLAGSASAKPSKPSLSEPAPTRPADPESSVLRSTPKTAASAAKASTPSTPIASEPPPPETAPSLASSGGLLDSGPSRPKPYPNMPSLPSYQEPAPKGIGFFTFAIGLLLAAGFSAWIGSRLTRNEIKDATRELVDKKAFQEAEVRWQEYQGQAKGLLLAVEEHMVTMTAKVDSLQAATDSLRAEVEKAHAKPAPRKRRR